MNRSTSRKVVSAVGAVILALGAVLAGAAPAQAAGGTLNMSVEAVSPTVLSGQGASFRVQWTCSGSGTCDNATISVPVPTAQASSDAFPGGVPLAITSQSSLQINGLEVPGAATVTGAAPNQTLLWTFPAAVLTGAAGTVTFTLTPPNSVTPNGATITPVATFAATAATPVVASGTTTVNASYSLKTEKVKLTPTDVPYVDQQVTYAILMGYDSQIPTNGTTNYLRTMGEVCADLGTQALQNIVVTDTLPAGATFVSANNGGAYNAGTNTITWTLGSSITDTAPYTCKPYSGSTVWTGAPLQATIVYPSSNFSANPSPTAVTNSVSVTANPWGQSAIPLTAVDSASHALRAGSAGATVGKQPGYDWAVGAPVYRTVASGANSLYSLHATSAKSIPGQWTFTDMLPCALTSPMDANDTDCATPAYTNLQFSADMFLPELQVNWTTNTGATGSCTIAAGTSMADLTKRYCNGTNATTPTPVPAGEWITKIEVDTTVPAFGGGHIYIHGRPSEGIPYSNVGTVYNNPNLVVDRSDVHPWFVTVENCPVENVLTFTDNTQYLPDATQTAADNGGICGYVQIMTNPFQLRPVKSMYDPAIPLGSRPAVPAVQTGDTLTVDLAMRRNTWAGASAAVLAASTFTPTVTEYLPSQLTFVPGSLQIVPDSGASNAAFAAALGTPQIDTESVIYQGQPREKITVTFPNATITSATTLGRTAFVRFQVRVNQGTPAGQYTNNYLLTGEEGGAGVDDTYLVCSAGTMVDANLQPTTDRAVAIGCLASANFTVLPVPGLTTSKTVQGTYDANPVAAPGSGGTTIAGNAQYVVEVANSGSVDIRNVVAYDLLPRVGDTLAIPGAGARGSEFPVYLTGPVSAPAGATVQYSTSANPCRGDLAGVGGGAVGSAPAGCANDWAAIPPATDYEAVTAVRVDFGTRVFTAGQSDAIVLNVHADGPNVTTGADLDGTAWNNTAVAGREASSNTPILPTEASAVGLQVLPNLAWQKTDADSGELLPGSEWSLEPVVAAGEELPDGWPLAITDCVAGPCAGPDLNPAVGEFELAGLGWGEYELTETTAPATYLPLTDPVLINITPASVDRDTFVMDFGPIENTPPAGEWSMSKSSDPASGVVVLPGDTITYTLTVVNNSDHAVDDIVVTDDLSEVLNNATFGSFTNDDGGLATLSGETITWAVGDLPAGETRTVVYTVTVNDDALGVTIRNSATGEGEVPPTDCAPADPCVTENPTPGEWTLAKSSDPASGVKVQAGDTVTYTITVTNDTDYPVADVVVSDDLSDVLDDATFGSFTNDDAGLATRTGDAITWNVGDLAANSIRSIVYTVTVNEDTQGGTLRNLASGEGEVPPQDCTPADPCGTEHPTPGEWTMSKTSDPATGTVVRPGDVLTYTLTVVNDSDAAVDAVVVTDDLSDVLDDATFGSFTNDDGGLASRSGDTITWNVGELAAGSTRTVVYTVTVDADALGVTLRNAATGTGEVPPLDCAVDEPCITENPTPGDWTASKSSDPASGSDVKAGDVVTYTLTVTNDSEYDTDAVTLVDNLAGVLDDATFDELVNDDGGLATVSGTTLTWDVGVIAAGTSRTVVYTVVVLPDGERGDNLLGNVLAEEGNDTPVCGDPDVWCTEHPVGELDDWKTVLPATGSTLQPGDTAVYTLHFENIGNAPVEVTADDVLTRVLDDADVTVQPTASSASLTVSAIEDGRFTITGSLAPGESAAVSYTVTVKGDGMRGDDRLDNFLVPSGEEPPEGPCVPAEGERPDCTFNHVSDVGVVKSSDPASNTQVEVGETVTYTLTFTNKSVNEDSAPVQIEYTDHMADVLDDATLTSGPTASNSDLTVLRDGDAILISGSVPSGEVYTVTYTVTVKPWGEQGNHLLANVVAMTGLPALCAPGSELCTTHRVPPVPAKTLVNTGLGEGSLYLGLVALLAASAGTGLFAWSRRRTSRA